MSKKEKEYRDTIENERQRAVDLENKLKILKSESEDKINKMKSEND